MKAAGIVRWMDKQGRIVIPKEMRRVLNLESKDKVDITMRDDCIVLRPYDKDDKCVVCNGPLDNATVCVCDNCIQVLYKGLNKGETEK